MKTGESNQEASASASTAPKVRNFDYPAETAGSKIAARARAETNNLSDSEREELINFGMNIVNGGNDKPEVGAGH